MVSRVLGFVRDQFIAFFLGSSYLSQAFLIALRIPNTFRELFAEGAFSSSFIPTLAKVSHDKEKQQNFLNDSFSFLFITLSLLTVVFIIFMPQVITVFAPGFTGEKFKTTVHLAKIMFPFLMFISLTTFFISVMQNLKKFLIPALTPIIYNIVLIASIFAFKDITPNVAVALSYGVFISGIVQLIFMYYFVRKQGISVRIKLPKLTPETKEFLLKFVPAICGAGIYYLNILVGSIFASLFDGAVSWFYFAQRIYLLPIGIIGAAISTVLLPHLSSNLQTTNLKEKHFLQNNSFLLNIFLGLPCALAMCLLSVDIVGLLFQYGSFNLNDTLQTAAMLKILGLNVLIILFNRVFGSMFFARNNTKIPAIIAFFSFVTNLILLFTLTKKIGMLAIPYASFFSSLVPFLIYIVLIIKRNYTHLKRGVWRKIFLVLFANAILGVLFSFISKTEFIPFVKIAMAAFFGIGYLIYCGSILFKRKVAHTN